MKDCIKYKGYVHDDGFGLLPQYVVDGKTKTKNVTRATYIYFKGDIPAGRKVVQTCDDLLCIEPSHLVLDTTVRSTWRRLKNLFRKGSN